MAKQIEKQAGSKPERLQKNSKESELLAGKPTAKPNPPKKDSK